MIDYIVIGILVVIIAAAAFYVYKAKKSGKKCIGCPDGCSCSSKKADQLTAAAVPMRNRKDAGAFRLDGPR